jgi:hypothetical protein
MGLPKCRVTLRGFYRTASEGRAVVMVEYGAHEGMLFALGLVLFGVFLLLLFSDRPHPPR